MKINHIRHPFKFLDDKDQVKSVSKKNQQTTIIAAVIAGIFSVGIAALPVFYGLSAYFRSKDKREYSKLTSKKDPSIDIKLRSLPNSKITPKV